MKLLLLLNLLKPGIFEQLWGPWGSSDLIKLVCVVLLLFSIHPSKTCHLFATHRENMRIGVLDLMYPKIRKQTWKMLFNLLSNTWDRTRSFPSLTIQQWNLNVFPSTIIWLFKMLFIASISWLWIWLSEWLLLSSA